METLNVAAAVIEHKSKYLVLKRAPHKENPHLWEFPGGKMAPGESVKACIEREIHEELGIKATGERLLASSQTVVGDKALRLFAIETILDTEPQSENLRDHSEWRWVSYSELSQLPMTVPDMGLLHQLEGSSEMEISFISPISVAKLNGIVYGLVGIFVGTFIIVMPRFLPFGGALSLVSKLLMALIVPILYSGFGAALGFVFAAVYNILAAVFGGVKVRAK